MRRKVLGSTIGGLAESPWQEAAFCTKDLASRRPVSQSALAKLLGPKPSARDRRLGGALAAHVGRRIDEAELGDSDDRVRDAAAIAAWTVPALEGAVFEVSNFADLAPALRAALGRHLPGLDWWVKQDWHGSFRKYGLLHGSIPAPPNTATGEPMSLELFGMAGTSRLHSRNAEVYNARMRKWASTSGSLDDIPDGVIFPTRVVLEVATYSNVMHLGYPVGMYA